MTQMNIQSYIDDKINLYDDLLAFIDNDDSENNQYYFTKLYQNIQTQKISDDSEDFKSFIFLISIISANHHRNPHFFRNIEQILITFSSNIKQTYSNIELFSIFRKNKRIIYFLLEKEMITIDDKLYQILLQKYESLINDEEQAMLTLDKNKETKIDLYYFYPEIYNFIDENSKNYFESIFGQYQKDEFNEKRKIGENDSYMCQLIRQDSIEEFITYIHKNGISVNSQVTQSIFETNSIFIKKKPTLIEYATFFGSIQIVKYLASHDAKLNPSLWNYAVHSNNAQMINFLEVNKIEPYKQILKEAIKCHHNEISEYIINNYFDEKILVKNYSENIMFYSFRYHNYFFLPNYMDHKLTFFYLCQFNYIKLVKLFLSNGELSVNRYIILNIKIIIKFLNQIIFHKISNI